MSPLHAMPSRLHDAPEITLRKRLIWVMLLRVLLITVLLGATLAFNYRTEEAFFDPSAVFLLGLVAITYIFTIVYAVWYKADRAVQALARAQLSLDLLLWGSVTFATGGTASGFSALFDLWVIVWAVVLGGRAAFHAAVLSSFVLCVMGGLIHFEVLPSLSDQPQSRQTASSVLYALAVNISALFLVAFLVNSLVRRLERTGEGLLLEQTKRADLARLHTDMIRSLTVGIATTDMHGAVLTMNPCGLETLDRTIGEVEGKRLAEWFPDLEKQLAFGNTVRSRGHGTALQRNKDRIPVEYIIAPLLSAEQKMQGFIVVFSDLTEIKRLESALERSRRLAALGELAAGLAHEIRNPLGALSGAFQLLSENQKMSEEDRSLLDIISREIHHLEYLVNDILDYARPKRSEPDNIDLSRLIADTLRTFMLDEDASERAVTINVEQGIVHRADGSQLKQVLINLLQNAVQATEPGGRIEVVAERSALDVVIEIRDTGKGIPVEHLKKIFDPFFTTKERGLGLGLALCRRIVEEHQGKLEALNRKDKGSVFRITLPSSVKKKVPARTVEPFVES